MKEEESFDPDRPGTCFWLFACLLLLAFAVVFAIQDLARALRAGVTMMLGRHEP